MVAVLAPNGSRRSGKLRVGETADGDTEVLGAHFQLPEHGRAAFWAEVRREIATGPGSP